MIKSAADLLKDAPLEGLMGIKNAKGEELWKKSGAVVMAVRRPGCSLCREEAAELSAMQPLFREAGVPLYGLLHQRHGQQALTEFKSYFDGELYLDTEKRFFGPVERRLGIMGLLRVSAYTKIYQAKQKGVEGNLKGDGTLLGAVYLIGPGETGILFEHREQEFGDHHNSTALKQALAQLVNLKKSS